MATVRFFILTRDGARDWTSWDDIGCDDSAIASKIFSWDAGLAGNWGYDPDAGPRSWGCYVKRPPYGPGVWVLEIDRPVAEEWATHMDSDYDDHGDTLAGSWRRPTIDEAVDLSRGRWAMSWSSLPIPLLAEEDNHG